MIIDENAFTDQPASKSFTGYSSCVNNNEKNLISHVWIIKDSEIPPCWASAGTPGFEVLQQGYTADLSLYLSRTKQSAQGNTQPNRAGMQK